MKQQENVYHVCGGSAPKQVLLWCTWRSRRCHKVLGTAV